MKLKIVEKNGKKSNKTKSREKTKIIEKNEEINRRVKIRIIVEKND